jgi:lipid-A-disaccharide synthase
MNLPVMLEAARLLPSDCGFVLPIASTLDRRFVEGLTKEAIAGKDPQPSIEFVEDARKALANAHAAVVASGTATVEAAVIGTPFVMVYRLAPLTYALGKNLVDVPFYAMPNLIAGRQVIPELVQSDFTPRQVAAEIEKILPDGSARDAMKQGLADVRNRLRGTEPAGRSAFERAAQSVLKVANLKRDHPSTGDFPASRQL